MRSKKVTRHYCDHCSRGMFKKPAMIKHEARCTKNPVRQCGMCETNTPTPVMERMLHVKEMGDSKESLDWLNNECEQCPACILAVIQQLGKATSDYWFADWRFKAARDEWWKLTNDSHNDSLNY